MPPSLANRLRMRIGDPVVKRMARLRRSATTGVLTTTRKDGSPRTTALRVWQRDGEPAIVALYGTSWWVRDARAGRPAELELAGKRTPVTLEELTGDAGAAFWQWFAAAQPRHAKRYAAVGAPLSDEDARRLAEERPAFVATPLSERA
jgi:hypothetical protein